MTSRSSGSGASDPLKRPRRWQRPPAARRLDLSREERAELEAKEKAMRRTSLVGFKATPEEKAEIVKRAAAYRYRLSDYARMVLLSDAKKPAPPAIDPDAIHALAYQLSKIGANLNQMMAIINEAKYDHLAAGSLPKAEEVRAVTKEIVAALSKVLPP